jgi:predicted nucleotidyltransferase
MEFFSQKNLKNEIVKVLYENKRVVFAYLYGSFLHEDRGNDIDIGIYSQADEDPYKLSADLKIELHHRTNLIPDFFDIRVLNRFDEQCNVFDLLFLKNILQNGHLLINMDPVIHADFLERYGTRFRECEGLIQEVLA